MKVKTFAKINLCLDVLRRKENGYHEVEMVMTNVDIADVLEIKKLEEKKILLKSDNKELAMDETNLIHKAVVMLQKEVKKEFGVEIVLEKNIPMEAGMAGGSADAAATLKAVNELFDLNISEERLLEIGANLGADIPFCIMGGTVLASGIGEKLKRLKPLPRMKLLIVKPRIGLSTRKVYESLDIEGLNKTGFKHRDVREMVSIIESDKNDKEKIDEIAKSLNNILEVPSIRLLPFISDIKKIMMENNCLGALMSGSGTAIFGIYENDEDILKTKEIFEKDNRINYIHITNTL
ncbi:4-(cytidine 5'-diphospho)-2-C-methyl-D-erythritol kinase [Lachnoanaerobaculum umeaense]|jgi:4-(cytidine 5'-diphospho)-2-C-methyl-D-erythritol kinase|uniref:4-diphosphocytidyl-2-C-methyl-D-erythritol kinase n=1 Tax=Lachnoanaerobaculum umeaense TaxID=617123 RepID=A0A385Q356_9FIRM|nr:4-(cytidine 5'-diphospho)-2-C-methyl-D-erythritol kinase [Lachnoanaerobaculum umeaense]AYB00646.1 4-(cytidine 5'-diphospho)-2-C-methyl-D-erythritol kinase [Lachnoanaerobaculum umeaense]PZW92872.1 4-diphosphocytidyl-2-C-methyl-D-erythritol kinase [Lachnoanaerobaculum umeaense]